MATPKTGSHTKAHTKLDARKKLDNHRRICQCCRLECPERSQTHWQEPTQFRRTQIQWPAKRPTLCTYDLFMCKHSIFTKPLWKKLASNLQTSGWDKKELAILIWAVAKCFVDIGCMEDRQEKYSVALTFVFRDVHDRWKATSFDSEDRPPI